MYIEYILVDSNRVMKNRLAGQSLGGFSRLYVFLKYNNMKSITKTFHLLRKIQHPPYFPLSTTTNNPFSLKNHSLISSI